jgi:hypothetical protein
MVGMEMTSITPVQILAILFVIWFPPARPDPLVSRSFTLSQGGEAVATITAGCAACDWAADGREAAVLSIAVDGAYSQHLLLTRGAAPVEYRIMLGALTAGTHRLSIERDVERSAKSAGDVTFGPIDVRVFPPDAPEYAWLSRAPILRARPGTVEHFSDAPLVMYAEKDVPGESGAHYQFQYTVIFTNEDGGTPTDRLMATWGRTTDIEFIYGLTDTTPSTPAHEEIQAAGHKWIPFQGPRIGAHPMVWVATDNNMVADHGPEEMVRYAPAPELVSLDRTSREFVMDRNPWMYAVSSAEMVREHKVDPLATPGSGHIVDPRRYVTLEACGKVKDATLALDIGVRRGARGSEIEWLPTDTDPRFRIARGGCFRGGAPMPEGVTLHDVAALRIRAYPRALREGETTLPPGSVVLESVNKVFMLDQNFVPAVAPIKWSGSLAVPLGGAPVEVPIR